MGIIYYFLLKNKKKRRILVSPASGAIIPVGVLYHNPFSAPFTAPLYFELLDLLEDVLLYFYHLLFFEKRRKMPIPTLPEKANKEEQ